MHASILPGLLFLACIRIIHGRFPLPTFSCHNWWLLFLFILICRVLDIKLVTEISDNKLLDMWSNSSTSKTIFIKASLCPVAFIKELEFYFFFLLMQRSCGV
jgi:hypothetical protein